MLLEVLSYIIKKPNLLKMLPWKCCYRNCDKYRDNTYTGTKPFCYFHICISYRTAPSTIWPIFSEFLILTFIKG